MTPAEMHKRATLWRNCGLPIDADMVDALADLAEAVDDGLCEARPSLRQALARLEALKP